MLFGWPWLKQAKTKQDWARNILTIFCKNKEKKISTLNFLGLSPSKMPYTLRILWLKEV